MSEVPSSENKDVETHNLLIEPSEAPKSKTKTDLFAEKIEAYPDLETARSHYKEIAQELGVAKSLGYKAEKLTRFYAEAQPPKAEVPTAKIPEAPTEAFPTEEEAPPTEVTPPTEEKPLPPSMLEERPTEAVEIAPPVPKVEVITPTMEKLEPILERSIRRLFNEALETLVGAKEMLTTEEAKDTAILLPIMVWRLTKVSLNEDQFIDMTCVTHFGSIILRAVKVKVQEMRKPKPPEKPPETKEGEKPAKTTPSEQEIAQKKKEQQPSFIKKL